MAMVLLLPCNHIDVGSQRLQRFYCHSTMLVLFCNTDDDFIVMQPLVLFSRYFFLVLCVMSLSACALICCFSFRPHDSRPIPTGGTRNKFRKEGVALVRRPSHFSRL